jgi:glycosidase
MPRFNLVVYEVFVRNHSPEGTFAAVEADLPRIAGMGVDCIWLMPVHPIGQLERKGRLGSPYSVLDYREVNPEYGSKADLERLFLRAHGLGLKVMLDVVLNHCARDSPLVREHPDWFSGGRNMLNEWTDVRAFNHANLEVCEYLTGVLEYWAGFGADGFRCDVASFLPLQFWQEARSRLDAKFPGLIWLAESTFCSVVADRRAAGLPILSDCELYQAFDLTYDYDILPIWQAAVLGAVPLARFGEMLRLQDGAYPRGFSKLRFVENHDQPRILALAPRRKEALAWTAFQAFNPGAWLLYAGQEAGATHTPSLFERDVIEWGSFEFQPLFTRLAKLKTEPAVRQGRFIITSAARELQAAWQFEGESLYGIFDVRGHDGPYKVQLPDGAYLDFLSGETIHVREKECQLPGSFAIVRCQRQDWKSFYSDLLDFDRNARRDGM